jgi:predicted protein tyrosine phosphatase
VRVLFVCSRNRLRSPTAEEVFATYDGIETASAGLNNDASTTVTEELLAWADVIFVMEKAHLNRLNRKFRAQTKGKRVVVLGIPDNYEFMESALVEILERRVRTHLRRGQ